MLKRSRGCIDWQIGIRKIKKASNSKEDYQKSEEATYGMEENNYTSDGKINV